jgi:hypothetical protein
LVEVEVCQATQAYDRLPYPYQAADMRRGKYHKGFLPFEDVDDVQLPSWGQQMSDIVQKLVLLFQGKVVESKGDQDYVIF